LRDGRLEIYIRTTKNQFTVTSLLRVTITGIPEIQQLYTIQRKTTILIDFQFEEYNKQKQYLQIDLNTVENQR